MRYVKSGQWRLAGVGALWRWSGVLILLMVLALGSAPAGSAHAAPASSARGEQAFQQGVAAAKAGKNAEAAQDFEQALLLGHTDPGTFYQLGLAYRALKRLNDAAWALSVAAGDPVYAALHPEVDSALGAVGAAGGTSGTPPALLKNVKETAATMTAAMVAQMESSSATKSLIGDSTYFVAPAFNRTVTASTVGVLSQAAADLQNNSTTKVKFAFLSAVPAPYQSLGAYAKDLFAALKLQRAVVVVVTPTAVAAYSDRVLPGTAQQLAQSRLKAMGIDDPAALAAAVARSVTSSADDAAASDSRRSAIVGAFFALVVLAAVCAGIWLVLRRDGGTRYAGARVRSRTAIGKR